MADYTISGSNITTALDDIYTTTWRLQREVAIDQILTKNAFWMWMTKGKGKVRYEEGGKFIVIPLKYGRNSTFKMMSLGGTISLVRDEKLTDAVYDWRYGAVSVVRYWVETLKNRGRAKIIDIMNTELEAAKDEIALNLEEQLFGDGTGGDGRDINGLDNMVVDAASGSRGTFGNIDSAAKTWWENQATNMSGEPASAWLDKRVRTQLNNCSLGQGAEEPDIMVTTQAVFELVEDNTLEQHYITNKTLGDAQFDNIQFKGRPLIWSVKCGSGLLYTLNTKYMELIIDPAANFVMTNWKEIPNQVNDRAAQIAVALNFVCSNRNRQGVIYNIAE
jgi:hypothetical protein